MSAGMAAHAIGAPARGRSQASRALLAWIHRAASLGAREADRGGVGCLAGPVVSVDRCLRCWRAGPRSCLAVFLGSDDRARLASGLLTLVRLPVPAVRRRGARGLVPAR